MFRLVVCEKVEVGVLQKPEDRGKDSEISTVATVSSCFPPLLLSYDLKLPDAASVSSVWVHVEFWFCSVSVCPREGAG